MSGIHVSRKGGENERTQLTTIVTEEVTVSSPASGGFSVTGGSLIGGASSEPALPKKNITLCKLPEYVHFGKEVVKGCLKTYRSKYPSMTREFSLGLAVQPMIDRRLISNVY